MTKIQKKSLSGGLGGFGGFGNDHNSIRFTIQLMVVGTILALFMLSYHMNVNSNHVAADTYKRKKHSQLKTNIRENKKLTFDIEKIDLENQIEDLKLLNQQFLLKQTKQDEQIQQLQKQLLSKMEPNENQQQNQQSENQQQNQNQQPLENNNNNDISNSNSNNVNLNNIQFPLQCTTDELNIITKQLPAEKCISTSVRPWRQQCSFTKATSCPNSIWLTDYYHHLHHSINKHNNFFGISIGCTDHGYSAINRLRMGTNNPIYNTKSWQNALGGGNDEYPKNSCNIDDNDEFFIDERRRTSTNIIQGEMHCIESLTNNYEHLQTANEKSGYNNNDALVIVNAAIAKMNGIALIPKDDDKRYANKGMGTCLKMKDDITRAKHCMEIPMFDLNSYIQQYTKNNINKNNTTPINILSIKNTGFDYDVLLGAMMQNAADNNNNDVLHRIEYIELEYNWMGSWKYYKLNDVITTLKQDYGFVCYFIGNSNHIWRITDCFLDHYNHHHWSNIACISYNHFSNNANNANNDDGGKSMSPQLKEMANKMEYMFQQTLQQGTNITFV